MKNRKLIFEDNEFIWYETELSNKLTEYAQKPDHNDISLKSIQCLLSKDKQYDDEEYYIVAVEDINDQFYGSSSIERVRKYIDSMKLEEYNKKSNPDDYFTKYYSKYSVQQLRNILTEKNTTYSKGNRKSELVQILVLNEKMQLT